ncbi:MAG: extracellular solute-binding protein [Gammaproteobacteria bacterium]|nr:extracellular solute-binding protein [Gammaproteobacteria bacterium]
MISRRKFIKSVSAMGASYALASSAIYAAPKKRTLRILGTHVTLQDEIRKQAEKDLGITLEFEPGGSSHVLQKAASRPGSFDLYEQWSDSINILWEADAIQPIDVSRLTHWDEINNLTKTGRITPNARIGAGDAPFKILNVQEDGTLGEKHTGKISFLPYVHNVDSFGYNTRHIERGIAYETESWAWLLDERWHGKVGLVNAPTIGIFDMALAAQAKGLMTFKDIGQMTRPEVDKLFDILIGYKKRGHFNGIWNSVPESVNLMSSNNVVIESMFSPAVSTLNKMNIPVAYAAPKEGFRAWHGVMCLSSEADDEVKDIAYEYMNWWLSGWAGAFIARQGYYISNPERSRAHLSQDEWDYWYDGKPARTDLMGTDGSIVVAKGAFRSGGSYQQRLSNVAVWNTVMDTYEYSLARWYEFIVS